jgi:hypothetical protein
VSLHPLIRRSTINLLCLQTRTDQPFRLQVNNSKSRLLLLQQYYLAGLYFFFAALGVRAELGAVEASTGGKNDTGAAGSRVLKWDAAIFRFAPSLNWIVARVAVTSRTLPEPHPGAPEWLTILPTLIIIDAHRLL